MLGKGIHDGTTSKGVQVGVKDAEGDDLPLYTFGVI